MGTHKQSAQTAQLYFRAEIRPQVPVMSSLHESSSWCGMYTSWLPGHTEIINIYSKKPETK